MKKLIKSGKLNRTFVGIICIVFALVLSFIIAPAINSKMAEKVDIVIMKNDITQGNVITENDIEIVSVGNYNLPDGIIKDKANVVGKYAACDIKKDCFVLSSMLSSTGDSADDVFKALSDTDRAISISIPGFANGLSGKLKNGDIVSIIVTTELDTKIPNELKYVKVITTTTASGYDADQNYSKTEKPETVTLLVNDIQAKLLAHYEVIGKIHLSLVYRGNDENANQLLQKQKEYFLNHDDNSKTESKVGEESNG